jgi:hypothetical protein
MQDAQLRQQCDALAQLLVSKATTLLDLGLGIAVGARAGWPQMRVASVPELAQKHRESIDTMMRDARRRAEQSSSDPNSREPENPTSKE